MEAFYDAKKALPEASQVLQEALHHKVEYDGLKIERKQTKRDRKRLKKEEKAQVKKLASVKKEKPPEFMVPSDSALCQALNNRDMLQDVVKETEGLIYDSDQKLDDLQFLDKAFGRKGIRSLVIDSIIPHLNRVANEYIGQVMDGVEIEFSTRTYTALTKPQEVLDLKIIGGGGEGYHLGSGGERRRVDFCVALALQSLLSSMGGQCNLFILDEPFESVDSTGVEQLLELLRDYSRENKTAVYCVTHLPSLKPLFDQSITIQKKHGVSRVMHQEEV